MCKTSPSNCETIEELNCGVQLLQRGVQLFKKQLEKEKRNLSERRRRKKRHDEDILNTTGKYHDELAVTSKVFDIEQIKNIEALKRYLISLIRNKKEERKPNS